MTAVPPGWYPDPYDPVRLLRYWDGAAWVGSPVARQWAQTPAQQPSVPAPPGSMLNKPRNGQGRAALICGILGLVPFPVTGFWFSLAAIITGWRGYRRGQRGEATNAGIAISGFVLGIVGMGIQLIAALVIAFQPL